MKCACGTEQPLRATICTMFTILNQETNYCIVDGKQTDGPAEAAAAIAAATASTTAAAVVVTAIPMLPTQNKNVK